MRRTYLVSLIGALTLFAILAFFGIEEGQRAEDMLTEQKLMSNVPYAEYFVTYAPEAGCDWEILAAIAYHESRYNPLAKSQVGARGLMQLMPKTGARFGLNDSTCFEPEDNIRAGAKYVGSLRQHFHFVTDSVENLRFTLASYNAGPAHIHDARRLAKKYGANAYRWADVEHYLSQLKYEEYYTDSVVQYGSFNAEETIRYVHRIMRTTDKIRQEEAKLQNKSPNPAN
ncbi:MAG: transglycosylase SLT domain-containing protein [Paludibacteraceae bacterium]|nr:transglycosylase SLT domain-containing protein [Paludibacteraceae bacterium]